MLITEVSNGDIRRRDPKPGKLKTSVAYVSQMLCFLAAMGTASASSLEPKQARLGTFELVLADFEAGIPPNWFVYSDASASVTPTVITVSDSDPLALPGQVGQNNVLSVAAIVPTWGGFGAAVDPVQDWSSADAISFWFYGAATDTTHEFEIQTVGNDDRRATFVEDFAGWRLIVLPFLTFGAGGSYDVSQVEAWVFVLDGTVGTIGMDDLKAIEIPFFADGFEDETTDAWSAASP